ncbi:MAG: class I SAM-dependent methyltransferase [Brevefilum sp.]|nr:class I SAM-dependent methyltransferase [Brevefilum sp.]
MIEPCPLCQFTTTTPFFSDNRRDYLRCPQCKLIFVSRDDLLSKKEEKARYDLHQNNPEDAGYHQFLNQFAQPLLKRIGPPPQHGLDFGSGPGPVLAMILEKKGFKMSLYDPYYSPDPAVLDNSYDFVTCTETIEHFYKPDKDWRLLLSLLKPGAWLGIMTQLVKDPQEFSGMHYIKDMTHVSFFSRHTFQYLADRDNLHLEIEADNLIFIKSKH